MGRIIKRKEGKEGGEEREYRKERWKEGRKEKKIGRKEGKEEEGNWARLNLTAGRIWPTGRMFDTPALEILSLFQQVTLWSLCWGIDVMHWHLLGRTRLCRHRKATPNLNWKTLSPLEIVVGSESAPLGGNSRYRDSVAMAAMVRYVFVCFSEWSRGNCSQRLEELNPAGWRTKAFRELHVSAALICGPVY